MRTTAFIAAIAAAALAFTSGAYAAEENWLECEGTVTTVKGKEAQTAPAIDTYAYNDVTKNLFAYSPKFQRLSLVRVIEYSPKVIKWAGGEGMPYQGPHWEGTLDRTKNALKMVRQESGETMTWSQSCKPTQPLINPGLVASTDQSNSAS